MAVDAVVGRLVDLTGRHALGDRRIALGARPLGVDDAAPRVVSTAVTAADGSFVAAYPSGRWEEAFVILDDGQGRLHLELELDGSFPLEVVVFLNEIESHLRYAY